MMSILYFEQIPRGDTHLSWGTAGTRRWVVCLSARRVRDSTWESRMASRGLALASAEVARRARAAAKEMRARMTGGMFVVVVVEVELQVCPFARKTRR
jgi:hypothetical protein